MRKRLNGVYSAEGFTGPTRRYVLIVAMLVGLASLPTLAAITAGTNELDEGRTGAMDVPFLPPTATGPVRIRPAPSASAGPGSPRSDGTVPGGSGIAQGQAQKRKTRPRPAAPVKNAKGYAQGTRDGSAGSSRPSGWRPHPPSGGGSSGAGSPPGKTAPVRLPVLPTLPSVPLPLPAPLPVKPQRPSDAADPGDDDSSAGDQQPDWRDDHHEDGDDHDGDGDDHDDGDGDVPDPPAEPVHPPRCLDRGDCSSRPAHHHRPHRRR